MKLTKEDFQKRLREYDERFSAPGFRMGFGAAPSSVGEASLGAEEAAGVDADEQELLAGDVDAAAGFSEEGVHFTADLYLQHLRSFSASLTSEMVGAAGGAPLAREEQLIQCFASVGAMEHAGLDDACKFLRRGGAR